MFSPEFFNRNVEPLKIVIFERDLSATIQDRLNTNVYILTDSDNELSYKWRLDMYKEAWRWNIEDPLTNRAAENDAKRYVHKRESRVLFYDNVPV